MGLFQKQPSYADAQQLFSIGLNKTSMIVGLGNIGSKFDGTRHNIGFSIVDEFVKSKTELSDWQDKKNFKAHFSIGQLGDTRLVVIKPTTLMNLSGAAVEAVADFYRIPAKQVLVVHDELDINFGQIRTRIGGSSAGHNGVQSVIDKIGEDFNRLRVGIGPKAPTQIDSADFVLAKFNKDESANLVSLNKEAIAVMLEYIYSGEINQETRSFLV